MIYGMYGMNIDLVKIQLWDICIDFSKERSNIRYPRTSC